MARSLVISGSVNPATSTANTTQYLDLIGYTDITAFSSVDIRTGSIYDDGILSGLKIKVAANSVNGAIVFTVQKNAVDTSIVISVPQGSTGHFEDPDNSVSIAYGDDVVLKSVPGGATGTFQVSYTAAIFKSNTDANSISSFKSSHGVGRSGMTTASINYYATLNSYLETPSITTESQVQHRIKIAGDLKGLHAFVVSNSRTTTTVKVRKNGADINSPVLSIGSAQSGWFGDVNSTAAIAVDDLLDFTIINGTGTSAITWGKLFVAIRVTTGATRRCQILGQNQTAPSVARNITRYVAFSGYYDVQTTENVTQMEMPKGSYFIAKNLNVNIRTNGISSASTFKLRKNTADSALSASITASTTGYFQDVSNTTMLIEDDLVNFALVTGVGSGSQTLNIQSYGVVLEDVVDATPNPKDIITNKILIKV